MKKEIIKPFDLAKAKAGAKLRTKGGYPVEIFKWVARGNYPIRGIIIEEKDDMSACWKLDGSWIYDLTSNDLVIVEEVEDPEFKFGDWVVYCNGDVGLITGIDENGYSLSNDGYIPFMCARDIRLWTIKDAKAGDVLVDTEGSVFIFRKICEGYPNAYGGINIINEFAHADESGDWTHKPCFPATKKQRRLLFKKMKEAGYEWNAEKLELKKIKPEFWSDDKSNTFGGFFIGTYGDIIEVSKLSNTVSNYNIFATKKQAKSALAMARISQIMANDIKNFGGVVTDEEWENRESKYIIYREENSVCKTTVGSDYYFLAFHTKKQRDLFLEKYPQLVRDFLMISDEETK